MDADGNTSEDAGIHFGVPLEVTKSFAPSSIARTATSRAIVRIVNAENEAISGIAFTDELPEHLFIASTPAPLSTCGGTITANAGQKTITFSGGSLAAGAQCEVSVAILADAAGTFTNTIAAEAVTANLTSPGTTLNIAPASASIIVDAAVAGADVPTLSEWMLLMLIAAFAALALTKLR